MSVIDLSAAAAIFRNSADSVLFVTSQLRPRELKMAHGMRRLGWAVGLIYYKWTPFDPQGHFDFSLEVSSPEEAHQYAKQLSPRVSHVFSGAIDELVLLFCRNKPSPVVIDLNDVFAPSLFDYCHERFEPTREALALAEGFCARDLQVKSAERADKFRLPPRLLLFPEYCWNTTPAPQASAERAESDDVHVVSVGTFSLESQGMYDSCYLRLTQLLIEQEIHLHIYPHWAYRRDHLGSPHANFDRDFADFLALENTSQYLHVHESLPFDELTKTLPQYDFGIVSGGCAQFGQKLGFYHLPYLENCYSGRIADYLDARLPVLINDEVKFDYWLLKRHGACIDLKGVLRPGFKRFLLDLKRDPRRAETMERAARKLSVDYNSPRLGAFYREIITGGILKRPYTGAAETARVQAVESSSATTTLTEAPEANAHTGKGTRPTFSPRERIRRAAPRVARILLPYRAIRLLEVRLHRALQEDKSAHATIATLRTEAAGLGQDYTALLTQAAGLEQDKAALRTQVVRLEQNDATLRTQVAGLEQNNAALRTQVVRLGQDDAALRTQVAGLEQNKAALRTQIAGLEQNNAALRTQVAGLEQNKQALSTQVAGLEQDNAALRSQNEGLHQNNNALQSSAATLKSEIGTLSEQVHVLSNEKFILQQEAQWGKLSINEIAGVLNWPEVLNDVERASGFTELMRILRLFSGASNVSDSPSACWDLLATKNYDQLLSFGYNNFKRTIGTNYFNFLVHKGDPQIQAAEALLSPEIVESCRSAASSIPKDPGFPSADQFSYNYFVLLLWEYVKTIDPMRHIQQLEEPEEGNPILVASGGRKVSQDLANSLIEYHAISECVSFENIDTVLEIGGGYGRDAYVILALNPNIKVTMVDIPPAVYVAQRYLSTVFKELRVFRARNFSRYEDVKEELEAASVVFLMPHQLALMPRRRFDLCMNISSFGEMGTEQVQWYFTQLSRITGQYFYMKQWRTSNNVFDGVVLSESDYPYPKSWRKLYSRRCRVQTEFFEALYQVSKS